MFFTKVAGGKVRCGLCRFRCLIDEGQRGICGVRENREGTLYSLVYGRAVAAHVDPIEKKPLYHVLPGSTSYSVATVGCNFRCLHCQNYAISQPEGKTLRIVGSDLSPAEIVSQAQAAGCHSISYTYTEPTVFFEYAYDTAVLAHRAGLRNIFVTNGYITAEALATIRPYLDAANIDLKGFTDRFYREVVRAMLSEVLDSIREHRRLGIWIELTTLVIPGWNDSEEELAAIARFIANEVGVETPWHVTQFYPTFRMLDRPRTPLATLQRAWEIGRAAGLRYVYVGNVPHVEGESTLCPGCGDPVISRSGFSVLDNRLRDGRCPSCHTPLDGVGL